jgi:hypothetical protein
MGGHNALLRELRAVTLFVPELARFQNVSTPGDWATYDAG